MLGGYGVSFGVRSSGVRALNFTWGWVWVLSVLAAPVIKVPVMGWG